MTVDPVRMGPLPIEAWQAAHPLEDDRGGPAAEARRDQMFLRQALRSHRRCIEPCEREAYDSRANVILARLDAVTAAAASGSKVAAAQPRAA